MPREILLEKNFPALGDGPDALASVPAAVLDFKLKATVRGLAHR